MSHKSTRTVLTIIENAVATVTLHRPEALNALNAAMFDELENEFQTLAANAGVRVILLTGAGDRAFAAGADIHELVDTDAITGLQVSRRGQQVFSLIENCGKPVIACINGVALGGGCELALACTLRIASDKAKLGLPEVKLGLVPGYGGTQRLPHLIGRGPALRLMLTAQVVGATEALQVGIVDEVVTAGELMERARVVASIIAGMAPLAISGILETTQALVVGQTSAEGFAAESALFGRLCATRDKHEGLTAFLEKRSPQWEGK